MKTYEKYKDSGIEWIGEIPEHWEVKRLKRFAKICNGQDHKSVYDLSGDYPILGSGGEFGRANKFLHEVPSVLLGRKGTIDKPQYVDSPFWSVDTAYYTDIFPKTDPRFFYYLCTNIQFDLYKYGSAVPSMNQETLSQIEFPSPSYSEQTTISAFLDRKTAEIDRIIANKQKLIALYEEEKQAIINQAVTKGLDPTVKLKDSGVEWLGEIPEHWEVKKLKLLTNKIGDGIHSTPEYVDDSNIYFINGNNLDNGKIVIQNSTRSVSNGEFEKYKIQLKEGSILLSINGTIGNCAFYNNENVIFGKSAAHIEFNDNLYNRFFYYLLQSQFIRNYFENSLSGTTIKNLSLYTLNNTPTLFFSISEQQSIVAHIEKECTRLDTIIEKFNKQIDLLQEYRTTLISDVVTGKVRVTE